MNFNKWLETFIEEKELDLEQVFEVEDDNGLTHWVPLAVVIEFLQGCDSNTKKTIKKQVVYLDYKNGDFLHYFEFCAKGVANTYSGALS